MRGTLDRMLRRFTVTITGDAAERLIAIARSERRDPHDQAALILERALVGCRGVHRQNATETAEYRVVPDAEAG